MPRDKFRDSGLGQDDGKRSYGREAMDRGGSYVIGSGLEEREAMTQPQNISLDKQARREFDQQQKDMERVADAQARESSMERSHEPTGMKSTMRDNGMRDASMKSTMRDSAEYKEQRDNPDQVLKSESAEEKNITKQVNMDNEGVAEPIREPILRKTRPASSHYSEDLPSEKSSMLGRAAEKVGSALGVA